jgi:hypothetical protein
MKKFLKWTGILTIGTALVVLAGLALGFGFTMDASAQVADSRQVAPKRILAHYGVGIPGSEQDPDQYLADALGISLEDLQAAEQEAQDALIQEALDKGLITQEQADWLTLRGFFGGRRFNGGQLGFGYGFAPFAQELDYDQFLAEALGISPQELAVARQEALDAMLAQAVADGAITQEQADLIKARQALKAYLDPQALFAQALGITPEQLQAYREQGLSLSEILAESGKTAVQAREALQAAYQDAIDKAVADGVITQDQADQIQAGGFPGGCWGVGPRGGFGHGGLWAPRNMTPPTTEGSGL